MLTWDEEVTPLLQKSSISGTPVSRLKALSQHSPFQLDQYAVPTARIPDDDAVTTAASTNANASLATAAAPAVMKRVRASDRCESAGSL